MESGLCEVTETWLPHKAFFGSMAARAEKIKKHR